MGLEPEVEKILKWLAIGVAAMFLYSCMKEGFSGDGESHQSESPCYYMAGGPDC